MIVIIGQPKYRLYRVTHTYLSSKWSLLTSIFQIQIWFFRTNRLTKFTDQWVFMFKISNIFLDQLFGHFNLNFQIFNQYVLLNLQLIQFCLSLQQFSILIHQLFQLFLHTLNL